MSCHMLLQGNDREIGALVLVLVQVCAVEVADAVDGEAERGLTGVVGDLELALEPAKDHADPRVRIDDAGHVGQAVELVGGVVDRVEAGSRIFDAAIVVQVIRR